MNPTPLDRYEDLVAEKLSAYQAQLDQGTSGPVALDEKADIPDELRPILTGFRRCLDFLSETRVHLAGPSPSLGRGKNPLSYPLPSQIGRFSIVEQLGFGGFGIVFRGVDKVMGREVAIKIPRPELLESPELIQRFTHEAAATAKLEHPNIVMVHESDYYGTVPYIVMAYIPGKTLARWRAGEVEVSPRMAAEIVRQLATGVAHAHERGVLHRDLKPGNVLLAPRDDQPTGDEPPFIPKLTDFGFAKCAEIGQDHTRTGTMIGTAFYMPPEQVEGRSREMTARSDVYGLGAIFYELLTGEPPFRDENELQAIQNILRHDPAFLRNQTPAIPLDLRVICLKCLEKSPANRYDSAKALTDDLQRFLNGEPISARPVSMSTRVAKWCRRHPLHATVISAAVLGILTVTSVTLWYNSRLAEQLQVSESARRLARESELHAVQSEQVSRQRAYVSDMRNAKLNWDRGDVRQMLKLLDRYHPQDGLSDIRDFAWWYLWREYHESSRILGTHEGGATAIAITRRGDIVASGGADSAIKLWSLSAGRLVAELRGHESGTITSLDFSPSGERLVSTGEDGTLRGWDVVSGKEIFVRREHRSRVDCVRFSLDGRLIASGGADRNVRLWNSETGTPVGLLSGHTQKVGCVAFHPTEPILISGSLDGTVRFWDLNGDRTDGHVTQKVFDLNSHRRTIDSSESYPRAIAVESNGNSLIMATTLREVVQISLQKHNFGDIVRRNTESDQPRGLIWPHEDGWLVGSSNSQIRMANERTPERTLMALKGHFEKVLSIAVPDDLKCLVSASQDGTVRYWRSFLDRGRIRPTSTEIDEASEFPGYPSVQWCGPYVAASLQNRQVSLFRMPERKLERTIRVGDSDSFVLSPSAKHVLIRKPDCYASCIRVEDGEVLWTRRIVAEPQPANAYIGRVVINKSDQWISFSCGKVLTVASLQNPDVVVDLTHPTTTNQLLFLEPRDASPRLISMCIRGVLRFWDVPSGQLLKEHSLMSGCPLSMAISKDQQFLAIESNDHRIRVWRLENMLEVASIPTDPNVPQKESNNVCFLGSKTLAYSSDGVSLWSIRENAELLSFHEYATTTGLAPSTDEDQFAVCVDGVIHLIDGRPCPDCEKSDHTGIDSASSASQ